MSSSNRHYPPSSSKSYPLPRPSSRRTASTYDIRPFDVTIPHHRTMSSSSTMPFARTHTFARPTASTPPPQLLSDPRFSRYFNTALGSPFLSVEPLNDLDHEHERPSSPTLTSDYSIIDFDSEGIEAHQPIPGSFPASHSRRISAPMSSLGYSRGRPIHRNANSTTSGTPKPGMRDSQPSPQHSLKTFLPRLWDVLTSPGRAVLNSGNGTSYSTSSSRTASPHESPYTPPQPSQSWYTGSGRHSPVYWSTPSKSKGKSKSGGFFSTRTGYANRADLDEYINYSELPPLDGEEGELIDDEACFIDVRDATGFDILALLPTELALHVLVLLCTVTNPGVSSFVGGGTVSPGRGSVIVNENDSDSHVALDTLLACRTVSKTWCRLASDNAVWRALFLGRWDVDLRRAGESGGLGTQKRNANVVLGRTWDTSYLRDLLRAPSVIAAHKVRRVPPPYSYSEKHLSIRYGDGWKLPMMSAPLQLDWRLLYRERLELDMRWSGAWRVPLSIEDGEDIEDVTSVVGGRRAELGARTAQAGFWEPSQRNVKGHTDSVYCLEFDSKRLVTGSRDRSIKVWNLKTGKLLGNFVGAHTGSVLCLKFEKDWDQHWDDLEMADLGTGTDGYGNQQQQEEAICTRKGFMVSGSSDCSVRVWDLVLGDELDGGGEREVFGDMRAILKGHNGGVLDLKIDPHWIVSCSKDTVVRVWDRNTLEPYRILRGHEGPVNAVGLQSGKVVSASGDGKLILWDIKRGERLRTFEGHDRGLACIEFKNDLIVSGSNDCKIKIWNAHTGECLRTLIGHKALVRALSFDPRNGRLVSASYDKTVRLWDLGTGKPIRVFKTMHTSHIFDVKFNVSRIVSTSHDRKIVILDFSKGLEANLFV